MWPPWTRILIILYKLQAQTGLMLRTFLKITLTDLIHCTILWCLNNEDMKFIQYKPTE